MKKHLNVACAVVIENGKVLAAMRGESRYAYVARKYEFVGGKIEEGETPEEALRREVREETGAEAEVLSHYMTLAHEYPDFTITLRAYLSRLCGSFSAREHERIDFLAAEELDENTWAPADVPVVRRLKAELGEGAERYAD